MVVIILYSDFVYNQSKPQILDVSLYPAPRKSTVIARRKTFPGKSPPVSDPFLTFVAATDGALGPKSLQRGVLARFQTLAGAAPRQAIGKPLRTLPGSSPILFRPDAERYKT